MRMGTAELFFLAVGLSMDALAVALCKGLALGKLDLGRALWVGLWFGGFQGLMPLAGWALGAGFARSIAAIDHWVAFLLLGWLGGNMLCTARADEPEDSSAALDLRAMLPLAVATSIDALAVGITFAFLDVAILPSAGLIALTTFVLSALGVALGSLCGQKLQAHAKALGGGILILLGIKILLEHLGAVSYTHLTLPTKA